MITMQSEMMKQGHRIALLGRQSSLFTTHTSDLKIAKICPRRLHRRRLNGGVFLIFQLKVTALETSSPVIVKDTRAARHPPSHV